MGGTVVDKIAKDLDERILLQVNLSHIYGIVLLHTFFQDSQRSWRGQNLCDPGSPAWSMLLLKPLEALL
jgi:hypothetical protein